MITLYRKHVNGIGTWRIYAEGNILNILHATAEGGSEVLHRETVETNLSGRSIEEQVRLRINSRVSRMLDKGYKHSRDEAMKGQSNQLGLLRPMLAQPHGKVSSINYKDAVLQKKLDGHRDLTTKQEGETIAYSRQGKLITSIKHILEPLHKVLPEGITVDGELYCHGVPLQTIGSWIKREQPNTSRLWYVIYDMVANETFIDRYNELKDILKPLLSDSNCPVKLLPCIPYVDNEHMWDFVYKARSQQFEGGILRTNDRRYEDGVRSSSLIKLKVFHDTEVLVKDIEPSADGWAICICEFEGKTFRTSAPGSIPEKTEVLRNKHKYINKYMTIEYSLLTIDGIPFHPNALRWHEEI